ncbi:leucyl/phenylalanyl-tRNA--protein transferase [Maribacter vaceletii]|uniref:Leucyl/phenylalanyl-tRNA--protein transferase n=1 Tax=Maribacter vaceletii TaxID=1206816 RepID=A0A495EDT9_9FLAO|nr:leucyl/phenylalanyl-tRNA--protein transferase [Maribacter vaceletii]RKR15090.1 leucyl/phenylalanyl-tRNA--protein transferase [Maribacter vaceletii]
MSLYFLNQELFFPPVANAHEDGLLAIGGDLSPERLILAYKSGIFPWFNEGSQILWWSPNHRMVLFPKEVKISKSMRKVLKRETFSVTKNQCFRDVLIHCATAKREGQEGTWITTAMINAYVKLHELGKAVSYEVWENKELVGGLYGIDLGTVFCGESMFSTRSNASKFAFIKMAQELEKKEYKLIDCQMYTPHLESLGAREIPRDDFISILKK